MKPLDKSIKKHYEDQVLSDSAMDRILSLAEISKHTTASPWWNRLSNWNIASVVFVFAITIGIFIGNSNVHKDSVGRLVLQEIAMNHNKHQTVEYAIKDYALLQTAMKKLDFGLLQPTLLSDSYQLVGGRYCSIQGHIAAQLKVAHKIDSKIATLYVTPITKRLSVIVNQTAIEDSVHIRLWKTDKLLYGLATDAH